jgi:hypothetical protein
LDLGDGQDVATLLERAIERSGKGREMKQIEAAPTQAVTQRERH